MIWKLRSQAKKSNSHSFRHISFRALGGNYVVKVMWAGVWMSSCYIEFSKRFSCKWSLFAGSVKSWVKICFWNNNPKCYCFSCRRSPRPNSHFLLFPTTLHVTMKGFMKFFFSVFYHIAHGDCGWLFRMKQKRPLNVKNTFFCSRMLSSTRLWFNLKALHKFLSFCFCWWQPEVTLEESEIFFGMG
jgi:hypothetical protein